MRMCAKKFEKEAKYHARKPEKKDKPEKKTSQKTKKTNPNLCLS